MDEFKGIVDTQHPHVLCIVNTLLSDDIYDSDIALQGYQILYLDRNKHGGGIHIWSAYIIAAGPYRKPRTLRCHCIQHWKFK